ncbi:PIN domain-containing protein [Streptomyces sp. NPDC057298]|uniref:PIN domain-containing protein n=1 Tax=Streptomyces sp. NPDC057298 TaxID=3346091 RepID=UPI003637D77A
MIIFDTNAVNHLPPDGVKADIIRKLRESGHYRVAVPWMVLEEMAAHQAALYPVRHQAVLNTLKNLQALLPWEVESSLEPFDMERLVAHWRTLYSEVFEVIETSGEAARNALAREAVALPPAARCKDHSKGSRDAAIWFSIIEFLKANPEEPVCLVTENTADFGDGTTYAYPMNEDIRGFEGRLTRLANFDQVVSAFTKEVSGESAITAAGELLRSASPAIASLAVLTLSAPTGYAGLGSADKAVQWRQWLDSPEVELLSVADVTGHEIEGEVWYTAKARWLLYGLAIDGDGSEDGQYISCTWEAKALFSTQDGDGAATLLSQEAPAMPDPADTTCMEALQRLQERVASAARQTLKVAVAAQQATGEALADYGRLRYSSFAEQAAANLAKAGILSFGEQAAASLVRNGAYTSFAEQAAANLAKAGILSFGEQAAASLVRNGAYTSFAEQAAANLAKAGILSFGEQAAANFARNDAYFRHHSPVERTTEDSLDTSEDDAGYDTDEADHDGEDDGQGT